jgi:hypothetical protein
MSAPRQSEPGHPTPLGELVAEAFRHPAQTVGGLLVLGTFASETIRGYATWLWLAVMAVMGLDLIAFRANAIWLRRWRRHRAQERVLRVAGGAGLHNRGGDAPRVRKVRRTPIGRDVHLRLPPGLSAADVERHAQRLAADFHVQDCRVVTEGGNRVTLRLRERDVLGPGVIPCPWVGVESTDARAPIPVGVDEDGNVITISLFESHLLLAGRTRSGKSVATALVLAWAALDPRVELHLHDGKSIDLALWAGPATKFVPADLGRTVDGLRRVEDEMMSRLAAVSGRARKIDADTPLIVLVIEELPWYLSREDRGLVGQFEGLLTNLIQQGAAAGIVVVLTAQKPSSEVLSTVLRDNLSTKWGFRAETTHASDVALGQGAAAAGYDSSQITAAQRGVGFLRTDAEPRLVKAFFMDDDEIQAIAARAAALRGATAGGPERRAGGATQPPVNEPLVVTLRIPETPPSLNDLGSRSDGRAFGRCKKRWESLFVDALAAQIPDVEFVRIEATGRARFAPPRRRRDTGNFSVVPVKALGDALAPHDRDALHRWLPDDTPAHYQFDEFVLAEEPGRPETVITLTCHGARGRS